MNTLLLIGNIGTTEILIVVLLFIVVLLLFSKPTNKPTWTGVIISFFTGTFLFYLILCHWGILGEECKKEESEHN